MKAWYITCDDEWGDLVHGETASKAKSMFWKSWSWEADQWIYMRAKREFRFDNIPINQETVTKVFGETAEWYSCCKCEICKQKQDLAK